MRYTIKYFTQLGRRRQGTRRHQISWKDDRRAVTVDHLQASLFLPNVQHNTLDVSFLLMTERSDIIWAYKTVRIS